MQGGHAGAGGGVAGQWAASAMVLSSLLAAGGVGLRAGEGRAPDVKIVEVPAPPAPVTEVRWLAQGETLGGVFGDQGLDGGQTIRIVGALAAYESPRRVRSGTEIHFIGRPGEPPARIKLHLDRDRIINLWAEDGGGASPWLAQLDSVAIVRDTILLAGLIENNLFDARLSGDLAELGEGDRFDIPYSLSQIFAWQIDFWRDLRTHDAYRLLVARERRPDGSTRRAEVLAAEFRNDRRTVGAVRFRADSLAPVEYYDIEGEALRGQFLLAPLDIVRVTSAYNLRRYHPILKRPRPHRGVDYGAARGTPVRATGAGRVSRAGWWGDYGTVVEIRHANDIRTRYAHLGGVARGVSRGAMIEQGQVIGFVGATGMATAPHLHYEFLQSGARVDPARLELPRADPVPHEMRDRFAAVRDAAMSRLRLLEMPSPGRPARRTQD